MSDTKPYSGPSNLPPINPEAELTINQRLKPQSDIDRLVAALDRYTGAMAVHTNAVRQNSEILTGLVTMMLTEEDQQDPDDEPMVGASMNSPRAR